MQNHTMRDISYFPGCSLATSAKENNHSLMKFCKSIGFNLIELKDWNCCGSSSAHSIDSDLAFSLATRIISISPPERPLLVACPSCILRVRHAHLQLLHDENARLRYEKLWGKPFSPELEILHFFELLERADLKQIAQKKRLTGLKFVPYYGCMLAHPPEMRFEKNYHGLMEKILASLGAVPIFWSYAGRCCGTFLSVVRPDVVTPMVNKIAIGAVESGAECIVTACAMCHLNLEVRCTSKNPVPILHFSEILSIAAGIDEHKGWFSRHIIDPKPLLKSKGLI